jgi:hypothetical protein
MLAIPRRSWGFVQTTVRPWRRDNDRLETCALHNAAMEEPTRTARQRADRRGSRGFPEDRDVVRVATERPYILGYPLEDCEEIQYGEVCASIRMREEAECAQTIVERYDRDAQASKITAIIGILRSRPAQIATSVNP